MGDNRFSCSGGNNSAARESYGIEVSRILDACRDRDCFENVRVFLTCAGDELIARTGNVRVKCAKIVGSNIAVDPIQFNRGFYSVLIRFYVLCRFEVCAPIAQSQEVEGIAVLEKRVVLFGGESNVSIFRSKAGESFCGIPDPVYCGHNAPEAVIEVVEPVVLNARVVERQEECCCCCSCRDVPGAITDTLSGALQDSDDSERYLTVSLGIFSVIRLERSGQLVVQGNEYCLPDKECCIGDAEDPCCTFRNMPFPTAEFCPGTLPPVTAGNGNRGKCCGNS